MHKFSNYVIILIIFGVCCLLYITDYGHYFLKSNNCCFPIDIDKRQNCFKEKYYAILASDTNPNYLFNIPIVVKGWKKLGVEAIVILIGTHDEYKKTPALRVVLEYLQELRSNIYFLEPSGRISTSTMAQISRIYAAAMPFAQFLSPNKSIFITSDADRFDFNLLQHIPNTLQGEVIKIFQAGCCGDVKIPKGKRIVEMIPLHSIGMTVAAWREVMGYTSYSITDGKSFEEFLIEEFGIDFLNHTNIRGENDLWYADQSLISYKLDSWLKKNPPNKYKIGKFPNPRIIDRPSWNEYNFETLQLEDYDMSHFIFDIHKDEQWKKIMPLLKLIWKKDTKVLRRLEKYKNDFNIAIKL